MQRLLATERRWNRTIQSEAIRPAGFEDRIGHQTPAAPGWMAYALRARRSGHIPSASVVLRLPGMRRILRGEAEMGRILRQQGRLSRGIVALAACAGASMAFSAPAGAHVLDRASAYAVAEAFFLPACDCGDEVVTCRYVALPHRVDCVKEWAYDSDETGCSGVVTLGLRTSGRLEYAIYNCRGGKATSRQIRQRPKGLRYWPLTEAAFGGWPFARRDRTPYGRTVWLGRRKFRIRYFKGRVSGEDDPSEFWLWGRTLLPGSLVRHLIDCNELEEEPYVDLAGVRLRTDGSFARTARESLYPEGTLISTLTGTLQGSTVRGRLEWKMTPSPARCQGDATFSAARADIPRGR